MSWFTNMAKGIASLVRREQVERELDEELQSYLEASAAHKRGNGLTEEAARHAAAVELGSTNSVKHQVWSSRWESTAEGILQDLRVCVRTLAKSPGFTATALLSLALGIGGNTAIFTLINQVLLRNLPVRDPQQLVAFGDSIYGGVAGGINLGDFGGYFPWDFTRQVEQNPGPFQGIAAYGSFSNQVTIRRLGTSGSADAYSPAMLAPANLVSGNYFSVLGAQPLLGRTIGPSDDATPGSGAVVVLSNHIWQQSLSSDPQIAGKILSINGTPFEVVGVMPEAFHGVKQELEPAQLWMPIAMQAAVLQQPSMLTAHSGLYFLHLFGRLSAAATAHEAERAQSQNWLNQQVRNGIREREGADLPPNRQLEISRIHVPLVPAAHGVSLIRSQYGDSLKILMVVVALVLLIACANLANFLLSRAATRQHEVLTRLALGSSRLRIVRQGLIETFFLSVVGGLMGLGLAFAATRALIAFVGRGNAYIAMSPAPDAGVLLFTLGISLLTGILFGLAPSIQAARTGSGGTLSSGARTVQGRGGKQARFWPKALVTAQVMLSLVLLVVAGLFLRTLRNLQEQDYGFERSHLLLADIAEQLAGYAPHQVAALHQTLLDRLSAMPGVRSAALSATPPISGGGWSANISLSGYTPGPKEDMVSMLNRVSGQYFETAGISILAGRGITPADTANSLKVAVRVRRIPDLELVLQVQRHVTERAALQPDVGPLAVVEPADVVGRSDVHVLRLELALQVGGDGLRLGDLLGFQPLTLEHVQEVHVAAHVQLHRAVKLHTAVLEQLGHHAVSDRRTDLTLDVVADDRHARVGELLGPHRVRGDEHRQRVDERHTRVDRALGVELVGLFGAHGQVGHHHVDVVLPEDLHDVDGLGVGHLDGVGVVLADAVERRAALHRHVGRRHVGDLDRVVLRREDRLRQVEADLLGVHVERGHELNVADVVLAERHVHQAGHGAVLVGVVVVLHALNQRGRAVTDTDYRDSNLVLRLRRPGRVVLTHRAFS